MFRVDDKPYGFEIAFTGFPRGEHISELSREMQAAMERQRGPFGVLVDLRETRTFPADAQERLMELIAFCRQHGMNRNAVVVNSAITRIQAGRLAREGGIEDVRFFDAAEEPDWRRTAEEWLAEGSDQKAS